MQGEYSPGEVCPSLNPLQEMHFVMHTRGTLCKMAPFPVEDRKRGVHHFIYLLQKQLPRKIISLPGESLVLTAKRAEMGTKTKRVTWPSIQCDLARLQLESHALCSELTHQAMEQCAGMMEQYPRRRNKKRGSGQHCRAKGKGSICLLTKWSRNYVSNWQIRTVANHCRGRQTHRQTVAVLPVYLKGGTLYQKRKSFIKRNAKGNKNSVVGNPGG